MEVNWQNVLEILAAISGVATVFGLILAPMFWLGAKIDAVRSDLEAFRAEVHQESKDFHGRLCAIEERNKNVSRCDSNSVAKTKKIST